MNVFSVSCPVCGMPAGKHCLNGRSKACKTHKGRREVFVGYIQGYDRGKRNMKNRLLALVGAMKVTGEE